MSVKSLKEILVGLLQKYGGKKDDDLVVVVRNPCLMEDEGRTFLIGQMTRKEAKEFIKHQEGEYFGPGDYSILEKD